MEKMDNKSTSPTNSVKDTDSKLKIFTKSTDPSYIPLIERGTLTRVSNTSDDVKPVVKITLTSVTVNEPPTLLTHIEQDQINVRKIMTSKAIKILPGSDPADKADNSTVVDQSETETLTATDTCSNHEYVEIKLEPVEMTENDTEVYSSVCEELYKSSYMSEDKKYMHKTKSMNHSPTTLNPSNEILGKPKLISATGNQRRSSQKFTETQKVPRSLIKPTVSSTVCAEARVIPKVYLSAEFSKDDRADTSAKRFKSSPEENPHMKKKQIIIPVMNPAVKQIPSAVIVSNPRKKINDASQIVVPIERSETEETPCETCDVKPITSVTNLDSAEKVTKSLLPSSSRTEKTVSGNFNEEKDSPSKSSNNVHINKQTIVSDHFCMMCQVGFERPEHLNAHLLDQHKDRLNIIEAPVSYECEICGISYRSVTNLEIHQRHRHKKSTGFTCRVCKVQGLSQYQIQQHMSSHIGEHLYSCIDCGKTFETSSQLTEHKKAHSNQDVFKCGYCLRQLHDKSTLERHIERHKSTKNPRCRLCKAGFDCCAALKSHMITHLNSVVAAKADKKTEGSMGDDIDSEVIQTEDQLNDIYKCKECGQIFLKVFQLQSHLARHFGTLIYTCGLCERQFTTKEDRDQHLDAHAFMDTYSCCICDEKFIYISALKEHVTIHDNDD